MDDHCNIDEVNQDGYKTCIRGHLLHYWAQVVNDPARQCARWLYEGAPAGLSCDTSDLDGVFPSVEEQEMADSIDDLVTDYDSFENYMGIEEDEEAFATLEKYHRSGYLDKYHSLEEVEKAVGGRPILSKLGCIKKAKLNTDTGEMIYKSRIILNCKRSHVSEKASKRHKSVLPRVTDAIQSALALMGSNKFVTFQMPFG